LLIGTGRQSACLFLFPEYHFDCLRLNAQSRKSRTSGAMPRRNAHGKVVIEETLNDTPAQKAGATENSDFKPVRHRVRVPIRGQAKLLRSLCRNFAISRSTAR
jgi:hypothetical protein